MIDEQLKFLKEELHLDENDETYKKCKEILESNSEEIEKLKGKKIMTDDAWMYFILMFLFGSNNGFFKEKGSKDTENNEKGKSDE